MSIEKYLVFLLCSHRRWRNTKRPHYIAQDSRPRKCKQVEKDKNEKQQQHGEVLKKACFETSGTWSKFIGVKWFLIKQNSYNVGQVQLVPLTTH